MTDILIDETTGLPALPDGQFWRVAEKFTDPFLKDPEIEYEILLLKPVPDTQKTEVKYEPYHWSVHWITAFWDGRGRAVLRTVTTKNSPLVLGRQKINTTVTYHEYAAGSGGLTRDNIRHAAGLLLDRLAREEQTKSLLGDYPPNTLEENRK